MRRDALKVLSKAVILFVFTWASCLASGQSINSSGSNPKIDPPTADEMLHKVDSLVQQNEQLEQQNHELIILISDMRRALSEQAHPSQAEGTERAPEKVIAKETRPNPISPATASTVESIDSISAASATAGRQTDNAAAGKEERKWWGTYTPNFGFKLVNTEHGDVNLSIYSYARYLNQRALQPTYTSTFGVTTNLQQRQDFQLQKLQIKFLGWVMDPKFRYFLYAWTSNASMGLPAQVVLAGNLSYAFNDYLTVTAGIMSLPGTRSVEGNFPFWLGVDSRLIADEFFRPSYTAGIRASGTLRKGLIYQTMIGDNNSILGVSAAQLPNYFQTTANALVWMPTTGEFGQGFGDFEDHQKLATRLAGHFSYSKEDAQEQPNTETFENTQLRLSDGSIIFTPNLFGPGISVNNAVYKMASVDGGVKYHGFALEGEYYPMHRLSNFQGTGTSGLRPNFDYGYQLQASAMIIRKTLQGYLGGSEVIGHYGRPWDFRAGVNYFPFKNRVVRWNTEFLYLHRSPVGYTSVPFAFGGTGPIVHTNLEMAF
ncbi:MAG TPA: hypothetical protein VNW54_15580 [Granulicella sp.]|jgi:hypothetical protein|nr:hypothetical protein [Granulicella sp.]